MAAKKQLGQILLDAGLIDDFQLKSALGYQKQWGGRLGKVLVENRFVTEDALVDAIHRQIGVPKVELGRVQIEDHVLKVVPANLCEKHNLLPISVEGEQGKPTETVVLAMADPTDLGAQDEVRFRTGKKLKIVLASEGAIKRAVRRYYHHENVVVEAPAAQQVDPARIQFGGQDLEADDMVLVQGTLESPPKQQQGDDTQRAKPDKDSLFDDDPFAELDSLAMEAEPPPPPAPAEPVPSPAAPPPGTPSSPVASGEPPPPEGAPAEEELPEVEIVDDFEPESPAAATDTVEKPLTQARPSPAQTVPPPPVPAAEPPTEPSRQARAIANPPPPPAVELEGFALDEEVDVDLDEEPAPPPVSRPPEVDKPPPIREVPAEPEPAPAPVSTPAPRPEPQTDKPGPVAAGPAAEEAPDADDEVFGIAGDLLGAPDEPDAASTSTGDGSGDENATAQAQGGGSAMEALLSRVGIKSSSPGDRTAWDRPQIGSDEDAKDGEAAPLSHRDDDALREALVDEVQRLLDGIEAHEISGEPPQVAKAHNLIAAVIRLLMKKDIISDQELLDELKRR